MTAPLGRREASKRATRAALTAAAQRLFAERGYEATTVADIAGAANVTHRTFYRYFDGKEDLIAEEYRTWLAGLRNAITARPAAEPPLTAVREAMISAGVPSPLGVFSERPLAGLRQSGTRPLVRFEKAVTGALLSRLAAGSDAALPAAEEFRAQVTARTAVAAFRSAVIRHRELSQRGGTGVPSVGELLNEAFRIVRGQ